MTRPSTGRVTPGQRRSPGAPAPDRTGRNSPAGTTSAPGTARIAVDLLGGDHAPAVVVDGALRACQADPSLQLLLAGPASAARELLAALTPADRRRVRHLVPAARGTDAGNPEDSGAHTGNPDGGRPGGGDPDAGDPEAGDPEAGDPEAGDPEAGDSEARDSGAGDADGQQPGRDPHSSIARAVRAVVAGHADAVVSAGPTEATVTAAALGLGRWPGARRPALAAVLPTPGGRVVLLDVGASVDPDAADLITHAQLGAAYAAVAHGLGGARIGLLSIGTEDGKGDRVRRAAVPLLTALRLPAGARYVGLVEGHEAVLGQHADVVVTDGFTGNVLLKGVEAAYSLAGGPLRADGPPRAALLLGVAGTCVVCHGAATADDVASGIILAARLHRCATISRLAALLAADDVDPTEPSDDEVSR